MPLRGVEVAEDSDRLRGVIVALSRFTLTVSVLRNITVIPRHCRYPRLVLNQRPRESRLLSMAVCR